MPERGVDGEDLGVGDVADGPGLGGLVPVDGDRHVDVHHRRGPGVGQVLRGGPHDRPTAGALQRGDGRAEPAAAEQERVTGGDAGRDGQVPAMRVVRRLQTEELPGVHGSEP